MRPFVVALLAWTAIVIALLFFYPTGFHAVGCFQPVGPGPRLECVSVVISHVWWEHETMPLLIWLAAGYVGIVGVRLAGERPPRH